MPLKDIIVCLDPTDAGEGRLRLAAALARACGAHLSAAYIVPQVIPGAPASRELPTMPPTGAAWMPQTGLAVERSVPGVAPSLEGDSTRGPELAEIIETRFREEVRPHALEGDWHMFAAGESGDLLALLRTMDLVIYGQAAPDWRLPSGFRPEDVIVGGGRPVLVVPYAGAFDAVGRRVLVAWDGTREASRALHDALPLMAHAEAVTMMMVAAGEAEIDEARPSLDRAVRHLQRHGIAARTEETVGGDVPISDLLLSRAADLGADLLVAGAYHHSQFREALLGGVSRELLNHLTLPVLMAH
jgi:nucleotide-binding universal stress UspA family protein